MLPRAAAFRTNAHVLRRVAARRTCRRFQSTTASQGGLGASHVAAGVAGGATVVLAGYTWYHFSDLKTALQTAKQMKNYLASARDRTVETAKTNIKNSNEAIKYLRNVARSYTALIPGAQGYVDSTFDSLEELSETHSEKLSDIVNRARDELMGVVQGSGVDVKTAWQVFEILKRTVEELQELGKQVGEDVLDKYPQVKEKLGGGYEELKKLAETGGPEARKVLDDTTNQLKEMLSKGLNSDSIEQARQLVKDKTRQIKKLAESSQSKLGDKWEMLQSFVKTMPGGEEALEKSPHVKDFMTFESERSDDAKQLAKETYQDILKVLEEKGQKAQKLQQQVKDDAEQAKNKGGK